MDIKVTSKIDVEKARREVEKAMLKGLSGAAVIVHSAAVQNATPSVQTGRLRASIAFRVEDDAPKGMQSVPTSRSDDSRISSAGKMTAVVGTNVEYAASVEFNSKRSRGYLTKALELNKANVQRYFADAVKGVLR